MYTEKILTYTEAVQNSRYIADCSDDTILSMNGNPMHKGFYNLVVSIRDVKLFIVGMKPHRHWKFNDMKKYFGLKGNKHKIAEQLEQLRSEYIALGEMDREEQNDYEDDGQ